MHLPQRPVEAVPPARILPLPVTPVRIVLPKSGLPCRLVGDPALLRAKLAEQARRIGGAA